MSLSGDTCNCRQKPFVITFIGWHNSGKTTIASKVVNILQSRGLRVGVVKSSSEKNVRFDTAGTDTSAYREAGAEGVIFAAPDQIQIWSKKAGHSLATYATTYFPEMDIVIGEGFKRAENIPKIEVSRDASRFLYEEIDGVIALIAPSLPKEGPLGYQRDQIEALADLIQQQAKIHQEQSMTKTTIKINGEIFPVKGFVEDALAGVLKGFVGSLKFAGELKDLDVHIVFDEDSKEKSQKSM